MDQTNATLLLVDDDAMNRDALSRRLTRKGYRVLTAESGSHALETVSATRVDAVLLDVMMPGMSGMETLRRLRESHSVSELPVIMVTANDRSEAWSMRSISVPTITSPSRSTSRWCSRAFAHR